jgi:hypothetical protein
MLSGMLLLFFLTYLQFCIRVSGNGFFARIGIRQSDDVTVVAQLQKPATPSKKKTKKGKASSNDDNNTPVVETVGALNMTKFTEVCSRFVFVVTIGRDISSW